MHRIWFSFCCKKKQLNFKKSGFIWYFLLFSLHPPQGDWNNLEQSRKRSGEAALVQARNGSDLGPGKEEKVKEKDYQFIFVSCRLENLAVYKYKPIWMKSHFRETMLPIFFKNFLIFKLEYSCFPSISLFQWVSSLHQVAKVLEVQLHHQFFQWIFRVDLL